MLGHETIYIDFMGHENSKKSVPWIESHPEMYQLNRPSLKLQS